MISRVLPVRAKCILDSVKFVVPVGGSNCLLLPNLDAFSIGQKIESGHESVNIGSTSDEFEMVKSGVLMSVDSDSASYISASEYLMDTGFSLIGADAVTRITRSPNGSISQSRPTFTAVSRLSPTNRMPVLIKHLTSILNRYTQLIHINNQLII